MRIHMPEQITGARDMLFVLDVQMVGAQVERRLEVVTQGALEALDLRGTGPGGTYVVPVGVDQLHIPLRVTADGAGEASVELRCVAGPELGRSERRSVRLTAAAAGTGSAGRSRLMLPLLALAAVVVAAVFLGPKLFGGAKVPALTGKKQTEAVRLAQGAKYRVRVSAEDVTAEAQDGIVLRQKPAAGDSAKEGSELELIVGRFAPTLAEVPDLVGASADQAESALRAVGFQPMVSFRPAPSPAKVGKVLSQSPEGGASLERDSVVELFVARAEATTPAPGPGDPDGTPPAVPAVPAPPPTVPAPPTVPEPPAVPDPAPPVPPQPPSIPDPAPPIPPVVPEPPPSVPSPTLPGTERGVRVPDVKGLSKGDAEWKLAEAGLMSEFRDTAADAAMVGKVVSQTPAAGTSAERLSAVVMAMGRVGGPPVDPRTAPPVPPTPPTVPEPASPPLVPLAPPTVPDPVPPAPPTPPSPTQPKPPVVPAPPTQPNRPAGSTPTPPALDNLEPGKVPDTIGLWREAAEGLVRRAGYRYQVVLKTTHDLEDGRVLGQQPSPGDALAPGQTVTLDVARTPLNAGVRVADVRGMDAAQALQALRDQGLSVRETPGGGSASEQGKVVDQAPAPGSEVVARSWVEVVVARTVGASPRAVGGPPPSSSGLAQPPAVGPGTPQPFVNTPRASTTPLPAVSLPSRDTPASISTPTLAGQSARGAIDVVLRAGLMPIVDIDRHVSAAPGTVVRQGPDAGTLVRPGDLVRVVVAVGNVAGERSVTVPVASGSELFKAEQMFQRMGLSVEVVEVSVPGHPYAGTGRVAAQYPVSTVSASLGRVVTLWIVR